MVLLKTFNGAFSACDRFMLSIFFYGVKKECICRNQFKQISKFLTLLEISLMHGGRLLKILMPI